MFETQDADEYQNEWNDLPNSQGESSAISNLFDNLFGWVNDSLNSRYQPLDQIRKQMLRDDPSLDIAALEDGFELEARRLDAIEQHSSRGFTIIDINPGLLSENEFALNMPYEFLFDGTNFIPDQDESITKNFRSVAIDIPGNFVKVEYIYETNTDANKSTTNSKPKAQIKYQGALKNTSVVNGQTIYSENNLYTGYTNYYFDNFARNKVFIGFGDQTQKPHIISKSGDYFKTYFNSLNITLSIGAPKIRITIGFNSEKFDGPSNDAMNSQLEMLGTGRLLSQSDTTLNPFNIQYGDLLATYDAVGLGFLSGGVSARTSLGLIYNKGYNNVGGLISLGYSVLWITAISVTVNRTTLSNTYMQFNLLVSDTILPYGGNAVRVYGAKLDLINGSTQQQTEHNIVFAKPIRVVIPSDNILSMSLYYQSSVNTNLLMSYSITGYALGSLTKVVVGAATIISTSKYITDSTLLSDYNRVDAIKDNI